jgi:radical SAM superfamily enzyme YgiQ (UPF0313 family)
MFQWFSAPSTFIFPVIPATAATMLKQDGFEVDFYDGIARREKYEDFEKEVERFKPDAVVFETKTPLIKQHWKIINEMKKIYPTTTFVLMGDHVTALPKESFIKSKVDYIATGGDMDVSLLGLMKHIRDGSNLPKGVWFRKGKSVKNMGKFVLGKNLDALPFIDRELTHWELYGEAYLFRPVAYTMAGRDCPMKCSFCSWSWNLFPGMRYRSVENYLEEVEMLVNKYKVREIFDDTGTLTVNKKWVSDFCRGMIERGLSERVAISTNARLDNLTDPEFCGLMKKAGFRLLKVGLESGNNVTLKKINKGETVEIIEQGYKNAKDAGLIMMLTIMVGYPWESREDAERTVQVATKLLQYKTKIGDSLQASVVVPYPGTLLNKMAKKNRWLRVKDGEWERYDMTETVLKTSMKSEEVMNLCQSVWGIHTNPVFVLKTLASVRSWHELMLLLRGVKSVVGHIKDYA